MGFHRPYSFVAVVVAAEADTVPAAADSSVIVNIVPAEDFAVDNSADTVVSIVAVADTAADMVADIHHSAD